MYKKKRAIQTIAPYGILLIVLSVGALLRLVLGLKGIPYFTHYDEPQTVSTALYMLKNSTLNPEFFRYGTFSIYLHMIVDFFYFFFTDWGAAFSDKVAQIQTYHDTGYHWTLSHGDALLINRMLQVFFGVALIQVTYMVANYCFKEKYKASLAAFIVATTGFLITSSSIIATDMPAALLTLLAVYFAMRYRFEEKHAFLRYSLIFCGLAAATKYNSGLVIIAPYLAMKQLRTEAVTDIKIPKDYYVILVSAIAFFVAMPGLLFNIVQFIKDALYEVAHYSVMGHNGFESSPGFDNFFHQMSQMNANLGSLVFALAVLGIFKGRSSNEKLAFLWVYPLVFIALMSLMKTNFHRNFVQVYPFMAIFFIAGCSYVLDFLKNNIKKTYLQKTTKLAFVSILLVVLVNNSLDQLTQAKNVFQNLYDSRSESLAFLQVSDKQNVIIAKELNIHPSDLDKLRGRYQLLPLTDIYQQLKVGEPATYVVPAKLTDFDGWYKERVSEDLRSQSDNWHQFIDNYPDGRIIEGFGQRDLRLSLFSVDPKLLIVE